MGKIVFYFLIISINLFASYSYMNFYKYPAQKDLDINARRLGLCMAIKTYETIGVEKTVINRHYLEYPEILKYLIGVYTGYSYQSGVELSLREYLLSQNDNTIDPINLYAKALELTNGDIFEAILTMHELLRNEARFNNTNTTHYNSTYELKALFFNKFIDIRGDLEERGPQYSGDHSGSWYRFYGMILYVISQAFDNIDTEIRNDFCHANPLWLKEYFYNLMVAHWAELHKLFLGHKEKDFKGKLKMNMKGLEVASSFIKNLRKFCHKIPDTNIDCSISSWLISD